MKTERVIRAHVANLRAIASDPCGHRHDNPIEAAQCERARQLMLADARILSWVLGNFPDYDRMVEAIAAEIARRGRR